MRLSVIVSGLAIAAAGLAVAAGVFWSENRQLLTRLAQHEQQISKLDVAIRRAQSERDELLRKATELDTQLGATKTVRTATETRNVLLGRELSTTRENLSTLAEREVALMTELAALRAQAAKPAPPAGASSPAPPAESAALQQRIAELEGQLAAMLARALAAPPVAALPVGVAVPAAPTPPAPRDVVRVGPRDSFVVLAFGAAHGAGPGQQLVVRRGTAAIARVQISEVRPNYSVAQVLPNTLTGQLRVGDLVVLAETP